MFERFTDRARKVMALANGEAIRWNHEYIGTEHILLGLIQEGSGTGASILTGLGASLDDVRRGVGKLIRRGPEAITLSRLPQTQRAKNVIFYAIEEARDMNHGRIGTEHMLLGLLREVDGVAAQVLTGLGVKLTEVRARVREKAGEPLSSEQILRVGLDALRERLGEEGAARFIRAIRKRAKPGGPLPPPPSRT